MLLPIVFGTIILILLTVCLPELLCLFAIGFMGYALMKVIRKKMIGQMIIILCAFSAIGIIMEEISPTINKAYETKQDITNEIDKVKGIFGAKEIEDSKEKIKKLDEGKNKIDKAVEDASDNKIWKFLWKSPNEKEE